MSRKLMNRKLLLMSFGLILALTSTTLAQGPWDNHKMHYPQLPDEAGWDVNATFPQILADDWQCSETGYIKDLHFWGSWIDGKTGQIDHFIISFHEDIPANPADPTSYSRPGPTLLEFDVYDFTATFITTSTPEGWYDPATGDTRWNNHMEYYQYDMFFTDPAHWLWQDAGRIYWVNISAVLVASSDPTILWGWKSTRDHWNDDACWADSPDLDWFDIWEPAQPLSNDFWASNGPGAGFTGGGTEAFGDQWWQYPSGWWNIWFYDHPLDLDRKKDFHVFIDVQPLDPGIPLDLIFAINWSTDLWGSPTQPPLPGEDEDAFIRRQEFPLNQGPNEIYFSVLEYNPEWVSIDIMGANFQIQGVIEHTCRGSLDLAFVVTGDPGGDPTGACCYEVALTGDVLCQEVTAQECGDLSGTYMGDGTACQGVQACCLPDGSCVMADVFCCQSSLLGGTPQGSGTSCTTPEACCLTDGSCINVDPICCDDLGGAPQGPGSTCTTVESCCMQDGSCLMLDPLCCADFGGTPQGAGPACTVTRACCMPDGSCQDLDPLCCDDLGGTPSILPFGCLAFGVTVACCFEDGSCLDLDPACCLTLGGTAEPAGSNCASTECATITNEPKNWYQPPDLSELGIDINTNWPTFVLADDFECTETAPIQEIHIWGSWRNDVYPGADPAAGFDGDPGNVSFTISLHADIPAGVAETWSMPGVMLAQWYIGPGDFLHKEVKLLDIYEGWMDPPDVWQPFGDGNCWEYIFQFDETNWFVQEGTPGAPIVYWVDVAAYVEFNPSLQTAYFGWKTSINHWNDDAVWWPGEDHPAPHPWYELRYPPGHPYNPESVDMAFLIGGPCDCEPGEVDGISPINILDIVWTINYKYKKGPAPIPYPLCSGDANCDCLVNILDVVYVINYKYKGGPPPCTCGNFIANCPGGLR